MWPWASIFSVERGPTGSASLPDLWDDPRTCSEDTWGLAQRRPKAWEMPRGSRAARGAEQLGPGDCPLLPEPPRPAVTVPQGTGGLRTEDGMGGGRKPPQDGRQGSWAALKRLLSKPTWGQQLRPVTRCYFS